MQPFIFALQDSQNKFAANRLILLITCHRHVQREVKNLNYSKSWSNFQGRGKKWSNISTRRQQQVPQKNNHSFRARSLEDSEFVFLPFFIRLRENLLLLLDFHLKRVGSTWCSNQWERDLKQNSVPFLAAGYVAFTIDFVLKAHRTFLEISIPVKIRSGKNVRKHGYSILSFFFSLQNIIDGIAIRQFN